MKKNLFILAAAALAFAACSNDEVVEINQGEAISFRPLMTNLTRAADITTGNISNFNVTAFETGAESTIYINNQTFSKTGTTFFSTNDKYYWPNAMNLDFWAYSPTDGAPVGDPAVNQITADGTYFYKKFTVTPCAGAANQADLVFARTNSWGKYGGATHAIGSGSAEGVTINFRHTESKVAIKLYNSNSNIYVSVQDVSICNIKTSGVFTYDGNNTDTHIVNETSATHTNALPLSYWTSSGNGSYLQTTSSNFNQTASANAVQAGVDWILIPHALNILATQQYDATDHTYKGACIKINLKIQNGNNTGAYIVGASDSYVTALWPISAPVNWNPGYRYTYTVDLAGGGYLETNKDGSTDALDPILDGAEIKFVSVSVDEWIEDDTNPSVYTGATSSTPVAP